MAQYPRKLKRGVRWFYKFSFNGQLYRSKAIYLNKLDAKKAELEMFKEVENKAGKVSDNSNMLLLDLINERLDFVKATKTNKYYIESRHYLKILLDHFGNISVQNITKGAIQKLFIEQSKIQKKRKRDNYVVNAMIRTYKALFFYGINYHDLEIKNPCLGIEMFPIKKRIKYIPTDSEIQEVLEKCDVNQRLLIEFVRDTGCRISEALYLRRRDVFDGYVILYTRKTKSGNLTPREAKFDTTTLILPNEPDERVYSSWNALPRFLARNTKGKWNWHNLRHRFASLLSKNNTPIFEIMSKLGHKNIETTQNYLQLLL